MGETRAVIDEVRCFIAAQKIFFAASERKNRHSIDGLSGLSEIDHPRQEVV